MKNIIITGGELFNKGAQAMTFIAVDELKKRFPAHQILVLSELDLQRSKEEREQYAFQFIGWYPLKFAKCQTRPVLRTLCVLRSKKELLEAETIYKNTDLMIDISGYALGSNWSKETCNRYLDHLEFAKAFHIPIYLMPQSFGPFDFRGREGKKIEQRIRKLLPTVKTIYVRERKGYEELKRKYCLNNVFLANDIVLNNSEIDLKNIYRKLPDMLLPDIMPGSIALIPNQRNYTVASEEQVQEIYIKIIKKLLHNNYKVYLISHSEVDIEICRELKNKFEQEAHVIFVDRELNCLEFSEIIKQFEFVIASRFHSIVHAFRNGIPCIALGWATKYYELMKMFDQEQYMVDLRHEIKVDELEETIDSMILEREEVLLTIKERLEELRDNNVFEAIKL